MQSYILRMTLYIQIYTCINATLSIRKLHDCIRALHPQFSYVCLDICYRYTKFLYPTCSHYTNVY